MPIYSFACRSKRCGNTVDELMKYEEREGFMKHMRCAACGRGFKTKLTCHAKTASQWADSWQAGLSSNMYSAALGHGVSSRRHEERLMKQKGFIPESDLPAHYFEEQQEKNNKEAVKNENETKRYKAALSSGKTKEEAVVEAFPAKEMIDSSSS